MVKNYENYKSRNRRFPGDYGNLRQSQKVYVREWKSKAMEKRIPLRSAGETGFGQEELYVCREGQELLGVFMFSEIRIPAMRLLSREAGKMKLLME